MSESPTECVFLVADNAIEAAVETFLEKGRGVASLGARSFSYRILNIDDETDSDLCHKPARVLQDQGVLPDEALRLVVVFDQKYNLVPPAAESRAIATKHLLDAGWPADRFHVTVIAPELETWMWHDADAPMQVVERAFRYDRAQRGQTLRERLASQSKWPADAPKPPRPKDTFKWTTSQFRRRSTQITVREIVEHVGISHCQDVAFQELKGALAAWFPPAWAQHAHP